MMMTSEGDFRGEGQMPGGAHVRSLPAPVPTAVRRPAPNVRIYDRYARLMARPTTTTTMAVLLVWMNVCRVSVGRTARPPLSHYGCRTVVCRWFTTEGLRDVDRVRPTVC